jgi:hypothetical protein
VPQKCSATEPTRPKPGATRPFGRSIHHGAVTPYRQANRAPARCRHGGAAAGAHPNSQACRQAIGSNLTSGADAALKKLIEQWATQANTQVQVDFLSVTNRQLFLVVAAEAQARSGHDVMHMGYNGPTTYAELLQPVGDVVARLEGKYGPVNETAAHTGKVDGHWAAVPTCIFSNVYPCAGRIDIFRQRVRMDLPETFPARSEMGVDYDQWTWDAFLRATDIRPF